MWSQGTGSESSRKSRRSKTDVRKILLYLMSAAAVLVLWTLAFCSWLWAGEREGQVSLYYNTEVLVGQAAERYLQRKGKQSEEEKAETPDLTAWNKLENQWIKSKGLGKQAEGEVMLIYGSMEDVLFFPLISGGFGYREDWGGCVVSSQMARDLFGTVDARGLSLEYREKNYQIRGVVSSDKSFLAVHGRQDDAMSYVELTFEKKRSSLDLTKVQAALGLPDPVYTSDMGFYRSVIRLFLTLPFWVAYIWFLCQYRKKSAEYSTAFRWFVNVGFLLLLGVGLFLGFSFGEEFIPPRWSDFSFWAEKIQSIIENEEAGRPYRGLYPQAALNTYLGRGILCSAGSGFFLLLTLKGWGRKEDRQ